MRKHNLDTLRDTRNEVDRLIKNLLALEMPVKCRVRNGELILKAHEVLAQLRKNLDTEVEIYTKDSHGRTERSEYETLSK